MLLLHFAVLKCLINQDICASVWRFNVSLAVNRVCFNCISDRWFRPFRLYGLLISQYHVGYSDFMAWIGSWDLSPIFSQLSGQGWKLKTMNQNWPNEQEISTFYFKAITYCRYVGILKHWPKQLQKLIALNSAHNNCWEARSRQIIMLNKNGLELYFSTLTSTGISYSLCLSQLIP